MAATAVPSAQFISKWDRDLWREYVRDSGFAAYMKGDNNVIAKKSQLVDGGQTINVPFAPKLVGQGVSGAATLRGTEEGITFYNEAVSVDYIRHAVSITRRDAQFVNFDLRAAARGQIKDWSINKLRNDIIDQLVSVRSSTSSGANLIYGLVTSSATTNGPVITSGNSQGAVINIGGASVTTAASSDCNTWNTNNQDRILYGSKRSNLSAGAHATSLGNVGTASDTLRVSIVELMKRMARQANPIVKPLRVEGSGKEMYVLFVPTRCMRDLRADATLINFNVNARPRDVDNNPIFNGGDMLLDNVVVIEIPELPIIQAVGASSADVAPIFLCGQQAVAWALGEDFTTVEDDKLDYEFERGISMRELRGIKKIFYNGVQHGIVTGFVAAAADT